MIDLSKTEGIFLFSGSTGMRLGINSLVQKVLAISDKNDVKILLKKSTGITVYL